MGSGQPITDPFLGLMRKVFWNDDTLPNVAEATWITYWTLSHAIDLNAGGIQGPVAIATLRKSGDSSPIATLLEEEELQEHRDNVRDVELYLRKYRDETHQRIPEGPKKSS
jgi:hypothetical protein